MPGSPAHAGIVPPVGVSESIRQLVPPPTRGPSFRRPRPQAQYRDSPADAGMTLFYTQV